MPKVTRLGHVGLFVADPEIMLEFYSNFLGMTVTDRDERRVFLSARPEEEHHELLLATRERHLHGVAEPVTRCRFDGNAVGAELVEIALDLPEVEQLPDGTVEGVERGPQRPVDLGLRHPLLGHRRDARGRAQRSGQLGADAGGAVERTRVDDVRAVVVRLE